MKIGGDVHAAFVDYANDAAAVLDELGSRAYDPDDDQDDAPYLHASRDEAWDVALLDELLRGANLPEVDRDDLKRAFACYALAVGGSESPTLYIRKMSPVQLATKPLIGRFLDGAVTEISEPLLAFDKTFDVIITAESLYALHQKRFEGLFKDSDAVLARAEEWVHALDDRLPLASGSADYLTEVVKRNSVVRRKLTSVLKRPYLSSLTEEMLREKMRSHGFDEAALLDDGKLTFTADTTRELLWLLNQDVYSGDFSGETFAAGSKRRI